MTRYKVVKHVCYESGTGLQVAYYFPRRWCHLSWSKLPGEKTEEKAWEACKRDYAASAKHCDLDCYSRFLSLLLIGGFLLAVEVCAMLSK